MRSLFRDLRFATRVLGKNPGFTVAAIAVMALGIGVTTAVFSAVYAVLLKPLAYRDPSRLVVALHNGRSPVSPADYLDYQAQATAFAGIAAAQAWGGALTNGSQSEVVPGLQITGNMLAVLGVRPALGYGFTTEDAMSGADLLLLSDRLWRRQFNADPAIVGRSVPIGGRPYKVVGVMGPEFQFAPFWQTEAEMWRPLNLTPRINDRGGRSLRLFARLRNGVSLTQAQAQMNTIARRLAAAYPATNAELGITVVPLQEKVVGPIRPTLLILLGTVGFVLIIACADIANLLLARAVGRRREMATRIAMGATRWQLVRQLSMESVLLAAIGGGLGILLAYAGLDLLRTTLPTGGLPRQGEIALDGMVLLFALALSLVAGIASGIVPSLQASSVNVIAHLKEGGRGASEGRATRHTQSMLVTVQVSMALVLMVCAGLLVRSLQQLSSIDPGFNPIHLLTFEVSPPQARFASPPVREALFRRVAEGLTGMEGVESVSAINHLPIGGDMWTFRYEVPGRAKPLPGHEFGAAYRLIRPGYFHTMQVSMVSGRGIAERDDGHAPPVVVINEAMARHQWPGENAVGRSIVIPTLGNAAELLTIVGVVRNVKQSDWVSPADDEVYLPYAQRVDAMGASSQTFVIRTTGSPELLASHLNRRALGIDPDVPVSHIRTMEQVVAETLWRSRVSTLLLSAFALTALLLAAAGIYSVIAYSVRRRTQELGIRVALGASSTAVLGMVLRESFGPVLAGVVLGTAGSFVAARLLGTLLYGVQPTDPLTFALVVSGLLATATAAIAVPAFRALRADPLIALRHLS